MKFKYLVSMRHFMVTLNFIIISFIGAQFLLITQYILNHQLSSELLTTLARVPASPMILFSECIISYGHDFLSSGNTVFDLADIKAIEDCLSDYPKVDMKAASSPASRIPANPAGT